MIQLPFSDELNIGYLSRLFDDTSNCYKFFWFQAIKATAGNPIKMNFNSIAEVAKSKRCNELGRFQCKGYDTFGPFKLVGGIQKGHPTEDEIAEAVEFYRNL